MRSYLELEKNLHFAFPIDGDCLNEYDGTIKGDKLYITARVSINTESATTAAVSINGAAAVKNGEFYEAEVCVLPGKNILTAEYDGETAEITVFRLADCTGRYRLSSDDNIIFLWDINKNKDTYTSIFDNPYLAMYKKAHDLYGAAVHINIYYEMPAVHPDFSLERDYFNLSMMTDKFKSEWQANSDWLKLNFHAKSDKPDMPYKYTDYNRIYEDCKKVQAEIIRFAGAETLSEETTIHWGQCTYEGVKAVRDLNIKTLAGYFDFFNGETSVSYFYPADLVSYIHHRDFWYDTELDVLYGKIDNVINTFSLEESIAHLNELDAQEKGCTGFIELMIHEEYFYDDYIAYIPEFAQLVFDACDWVANHKGYKGTFLNDIRMK